MLGKVFSQVFWGTIGLLILYMIYGVIDEELTLRKYATIFSQAQHPQGTISLDTIRIRSSFYPATYVDDSIGFKSAVVIAELRQHIDTWTDIDLFYHHDNRLKDGSPVIAIPLEIQRGNERTWLAVVDGHFLGPSEERVVLLVQEHYGSRGIPKTLNGTERNLYLVYSLWVEEQLSVREK